MHPTRFCPCRAHWGGRLVRGRPPGRPIPWLALLLCVQQLHAREHHGKIALIDENCAAIRAEFAEQLPRYFAGPDPWQQIDHMAASLADQAFASVYSEGARVRWVVLDMGAPQDEWFQQTDYFFDAEGFTLERRRVLENRQANIHVEETIYYERGREIKTVYRHSAQRRGSNSHENWDVFTDPQAPEYISTADLPVPFQEPVFRQLG